ncbi:hypothetical protein ACFSR7_12495 [Cohnella sp. GCM10020058]|uniref:hypothetical protein n=1 Tax=Cohnella sp. GCM10020058 TaxID=3317330 RepID=UPI003644DE90
MSQFTTTLEAVSSNKSKTTIKLSLSNAEARKFTALYLNSIDKELVVTFDDPQMEMEIERTKAGRSVATINSRGEVEGFTPATPAPEDSEPSDADEVLVQEDSWDYEVVDDAAEDQNHDPEPEGDENQDPDPDSDAAADEPAEESGELTEEEPDGEVDPKELEQFILTERPKFDDIPFNFPEMIERKKADGLKWHEMPKVMGLNISSTKLQQFYGVYKKRCKKKILGAA